MKKLLSLLLSITMLFSVTFPVSAIELEKYVAHNEPAKLGTVLDLRDETSIRAEIEYDVIVLSEKQMNEDILLKDTSTPIFVFSDNKDRVSIMNSIGYKTDVKSDVVGEVEECTLIGYYIVDGESSPWYVHKEADEKMVLEDIAKLSLKKISTSATASTRGSWSPQNPKTPKPLN